MCKCGATFKVVQTYQAGGTAHTQRLQCPRCNTVGTVIAQLVYVDPERGQGAFALAETIKRLGRVPSLDGAESVDDESQGS